VVVVAAAVALSAEFFAVEKLGGWSEVMCCNSSTDLPEVAKTNAKSQNLPKIVYSKNVLRNVDV
jgi:hypothetical protein